jgi:ribulose-phosphate 3-epimerase
MVQLSASLLSAHWAYLARDVERIKALGVERLHFDVMDGHFVPNLTFGAGVLQALRPLTPQIFEAHLMVDHPDDFIPAMAHAGADIIVIHPESTQHLHRSLSAIRALGKKAGVALNPSTGLEDLRYVRDLVDHVLVMTVNPGFGGQSFIHSVLPKIAQLKTFFGGSSAEIAVDGGIDLETAPLAVQQGAQVLIAGTALFRGGELEQNAQVLRQSFESISL